MIAFLNINFGFSTKRGRGCTFTSTSSYLGSVQSRQESPHHLGASSHWKTGPVELHAHWNMPTNSTRTTTVPKFGDELKAFVEHQLHRRNTPECIRICLAAPFHVAYQSQTSRSVFLFSPCFFPFQPLPLSPCKDQLLLSFALLGPLFPSIFSTAFTLSLSATRRLSTPIK